jgi:hypothetical protein
MVRRSQKLGEVEGGSSHEGRDLGVENMMKIAWG